MTETPAQGKGLLSVVTPAYREGHRIYESLNLLRSSLEALDRPYEIIVVSDGSPDNTVAEAERHDDIRVLVYEQQRGKGYAIRYGVDNAKGDVIAFIDSDMELHPDGIGGLVAKVEAGADVAVGSKRDPASSVEYPFFRRLQSRIYQQLIHHLFRLDLSDTQTGLKAFRADLLREVAPELSSNGFAFDLELLVALNDRGAVIVEGPVDLDYSFETTTGAKAVLDVLRDTWTIYRRRRRSRQTRG
ncbi:MAG: glycosyltransferase family 2 protein [Acidimicrobiales bacterium]